MMTINCKRICLGGERTTLPIAIGTAGDERDMGE